MHQKTIIFRFVKWKDIKNLSLKIFTNMIVYASENNNISIRQVERYKKFIIKNKWLT
jgi:hypothetical protein